MMPGVVLLDNLALDAAHERLGAVLTDLERAVNAGVASEQVLEFLALLEKETHRHFAAEQELMERDGYEGRLVHQKQHDHLLRCLGFIEREYSEWDVTPDKAVIAFLWRWLNEHITTDDREYTEWLKGRPPATRERDGGLPGRIHDGS